MKLQINLLLISKTYYTLKFLYFVRPAKTEINTSPSFPFESNKWRIIMSLLADDTHLEEPINCQVSFF